MRDVVGEYTIGETVFEDPTGVNRNLGVVVLWDTVNKLLVIDQTNTLSKVINLNKQVLGGTSGATSFANEDYEIPAMHDTFNATECGVVFVLHKTATPYAPISFTHSSPVTAALLYSPDKAEVKVNSISDPAGIKVTAPNATGKNLMALDNIRVDVDGKTGVPGILFEHPCNEACGFWMNRMVSQDYNFAPAFVINVQASNCAQLPVVMVNTLMFTNLSQDPTDSELIKVISASNYPQIKIIHSTLDGSHDSSNDDDDDNDREGKTRAVFGITTLSTVVVPAIIRNSIFVRFKRWVDDFNIAFEVHSEGGNIIYRFRKRLVGLVQLPTVRADKFTNPRFVTNDDHDDDDSSPTQINDFSITSSDDDDDDASPAIDCAVPSKINVDLAGVARPIGLENDTGAFEGEVIDDDHDDHDNGDDDD